MTSRGQQISQLLRGLTLIDATSIVVGSIIGTGVFLKSATMAQQTGSPFWLLAAWLFAGLLSLAGALTYAELGSLFPKAGGEYVYLRSAYGNLVGFLYGWMRFWIAGPGSIAAYAAGAATFLGAFVTYESDLYKSIVAVLLIALFSLLNCLKVSVGGKIQSVMTAVKILVLIFLSLGVLLKSSPATSAGVLSTSGAWPGWSSFGAAMIAALWAFDGWNNLPMVAGEVEKPKRNIPLALIVGTGLVLCLYGLVNFAYLYALPFVEIQNANSSLHPSALPVATKAAQSFLGESGIIIVSAAFVFSALGGMNGSILTSARVPFAMAQDGLFPKLFAAISHSSRVPVIGILLQGVWASVLALSGTFDQLTDYVVFASWIFYALAAASVWIFRQRKHSEERSYSVWGYPVLPAVFLLVALALLLNTLITSPRESLAGLGLIGLGVPVYWFWAQRR